MSDDSSELIIVSPPSIEISNEPMAVVDSPKEDSDPIAAVLAAHEGDPDWSPEELKKAQEADVNFDINGEKSPGEFNRATPLYNKIKAMKAEHTKQMHKLEKQMAALEQRLTKEKEEAVKNTLLEIQAKQREAAKFGDLDTYDKLAEDQRKLQETVAVAPAIPKGAEDFYERNESWLNGDTPEDSVMRDVVGAFEQRLLQRRMAEGKRALSPAELAAHLETYAKTQFPHRFENSAQSRPPAVAAAESPRIKTKEPTITFDDLNAFQQAACQRFIKNNPGATQAEYIKMLKSAGSSVTFE